MSSKTRASGSHRARLAPLGLAGALAVSACALAGAAQAQDAKQFFEGKRMQIVVGFDAGGGYDAYARLISRSMSRHIPGNPTFIIQNMPGAGSRVAANWLYNVAPKDGTVLGTVVQSTPIDQMFKEPGVQYDAARFNWIGNPIIDNLVSLTWAQSGLASMEDVKAKGGLVCGSSGAGPTVVYPNAISKLLQRNVRVVSGYPGVSAVTLAMQRGEVNCNGGQAWSSAKATMAQLLKDKQLAVIVQWGTEADPDISAVAGHDVPLITKYARSDADRAALNLLASTSALSRPLLGPPSIPEDRVAVLRAAFDATMKDPAFLEDAKKGAMDVKPMSGADIQKLVEGIIKTPPEAVELAIQLAK